MLLFKYLRHIFRRSSRISFYESETMRQAAESAPPIQLAWLSDEALHRIVETEGKSLRAEIAAHEIEMRQNRRTSSAASSDHLLTAR
tara:strand:+ start:380137 stop:380397 length:261 start_codon:yes stop_codon:yes gene_type:complete